MDQQMNVRVVGVPVNTRDPTQFLGSDAAKPGGIKVNDQTVVSCQLADGDRLTIGATNLRYARKPVIHIASHFSFRPGEDDASFLLLGNGETFSLADFKQEAGLFNGVELLALSACGTAAQQANAFGR
jgi:CHAT domain-containing protein